MDDRPLSLEELESMLAAATANLRQLQKAFSITKAASAETEKKLVKMPTTLSRQRTKRKRNNEVASVSRRKLHSYVKSRVWNGLQQWNSLKREQPDLLGCFDSRNSSSAGNRLAVTADIQRKSDVTTTVNKAEPPITDAMSGGATAGGQEEAEMHHDDHNSRHGDRSTYTTRDVRRKLEIVKKQGEEGKFVPVDRFPKPNVVHSVRHRGRPVHVSQTLVWAGSMHDLEVSKAHSDKLSSIRGSVGIDVASIVEARLRLVEHYRQNAARHNEQLQLRWRFTVKDEADEKMQGGSRKRKFREQGGAVAGTSKTVIIDTDTITIIA